jgi:hypothetical protein
MRIVSMIGVALAGLLLSACATSTSNFIADTLPEWAGGLPPDAPPRPGTPGYQAYLQQIKGDAVATAPPVATAASANPQPVATAAPASPPPRRSQDSVDQPIH